MTQLACVHDLRSQRFLWKALARTSCLHNNACTFIYHHIIMRNAFSTVLKLVLLITVAGCASSPPRGITRETAASIKRVAPISFFANTFTRKYVGLTVFGNEREQLDITDWGMNAAYEDQMASAIKQIPGWVAIQAPYPKTRFEHVNDATGALWRTVTDEPNWAAIAEATREYCIANSLDAVLIAAVWNDLDFFGATNQANHGVGIYVRGPGERVSILYAMAKVGLIDCTSGTPLAVRRLLVGHKTSDRTGHAIPVKHLSGEISRTPIPEWSAEMRTTIRSDLAALPKQAWSATINRMLQPE